MYSHYQENVCSFPDTIALKRKKNSMGEPGGNQIKEETIKGLCE